MKSSLDALLLHEDMPSESPRSALPQLRLLHEKDHDPLLLLLPPWGLPFLPLLPDRVLDLLGPSLVLLPPGVEAAQPMLGFSGASTHKRSQNFPVSKAQARLPPLAGLDSRALGLTAPSRASALLRRELLLLATNAVCCNCYWLCRSCPPGGRMIRETPVAFGRNQTSWRKLQPFKYGRSVGSDWLRL